MASIRKIKTKFGETYCVDVRLKGFSPLRRSFSRRSEALEWAEDVENALRNNLPLPGETICNDDKIIKDAVTQYLAITGQDKTRSRHTVLTDRGTGERLIRRFGKFSLRTLTREDIEEYKMDRLAVVGPASIRHDMSMLSRIYEVARIKWRMKGLDYPGRDIKLPAPPTERRVVVPVEKFGALLGECRKSKNPMLFPLVNLLLNTGMRPEEAVLLKWWQVRDNESLIDLTKTKTEPRRVPLSDGVLAMFSTMPRTDAGYVFVSPETAAKDKPVRFFRRSFEEACVRAGINTRGGSGKNVTLYSLRHSAATYMLANGVDLETVRDILGHSNISQTSKYLHMSDDHKKKAVNIDGLPWK